MTGLWLASYIVLWVLVAVLSVALVSTLRNLGVVYTMVAKQAGSGAAAPPQSKRTALDAGQEVPDLRWYTAGGETRRTSDFRGGSTAFAVVSPGCGSCATYLEILAQDGADPLDESVQRLVVISLGTPEETQQLLDSVQARTRKPVPPVLFDRDAEVLSRWGLTTMPATVVVDAGMHVVRQVFGGGPQPRVAVEV